MVSLACLEQNNTCIIGHYAPVWENQKLMGLPLKLTPELAASNTHDLSTLPQSQFVLQAKEKKKPAFYVYLYLCGPRGMEEKVQGHNVILRTLKAHLPKKAIPD